ncbi:hypothetical protein [Desmospora activa]|uniref:Uncharacterized protein n=1 Tax=Desmospora activa DSM 45169 TaxID=1121389 RepID=A0A2T4ZC81_9BACL|nr:hypothetical protein [Desmospora activa]PTM59482.1 hypothetical protein C8J48_2105 [Desmospora activa DSM 45169]
MEELFKLLFANGFITLLVIYFIISAVSRMLKGAAEEKRRQQQSPKKQTKQNSWAQAKNQGIQETKELKERLKEKHRHRLSDDLAENPIVMMEASSKKSSSPWAKLPKQEWKRGIILKEILDPPKARRRSGYPYR